MSSYVFTISGTDREIEVETFNISETLNAVDTMTIDVRSLPSGSPYRPPINAPVVCTEDGTPIFGGLVESAEETGFGGYSNTTGIVTRVTVKSYYQYLSRKVLTVTLAAGTLKSQLTALVALYPVVFGLTLSGSQADGPTMPEFTFNQTSGDQILTALMTAATSASGGTGWVAKVSPTKVLRARAVGDEVCGFNVVDGDGHAVHDVTVERTRNDLYANKINGIFSGAGPATSTETFVAADGVSAGGFTRFTAKYPASDSQNDWWPNELTFDGVDQGPIEFGVALPFAWSWDHANHQLVYDESFIGYAFPTGSQVVSIKYTIAYPFTLTAVDAVAYAADPWERTIEIGQGLNLEAAQALLNGMLLQQSPVKSVVHYQTRETAVHPGMTQTATVAKRDLNDTVLVQEVETTRLTSTEVIRAVSAVPSQVYQGTFRETLAQWMQAGKGNGGVQATDAAMGALPSPPEGAVQYDFQGGFGGHALLIADPTRRLDTYGPFTDKATFAVGVATGTVIGQAWFNQVAGKALAAWTEIDNLGRFSINGAGPETILHAWNGNLDLGADGSIAMGVGDPHVNYMLVPAMLDVGALMLGMLRITADFTLDPSTTLNAALWHDSASNHTLNLPMLSAATVLSGVIYQRTLFVKNGAAGGTLTIDPNGSETIEGAATLVLQPKQAVIIVAKSGTGADWKVLSSFGIATSSGPGSGDVVGPSSATSGDLALFDGTTGKLIKDGSIDTDLLFTGTVLGTQAGIRKATVNLNNAQIIALPTTPFEVVPAPSSGFRIKVLASSTFLHLVAAYTNINTTYAAFVLAHTDAATGSWEAQGPVNDNSTATPVTALTDWLGASPFDKVMDFVPLMAGFGDLSAGLWILPSLTSDYAGVNGLSLVVSIDNSGSGVLTAGDAGNTLRVTVYYVIEAIP